MDSNHIHNPLMHGGDFPLQPPDKEVAWEDMRRRLDEIMPVTPPLPLKDVAVYADGKQLYSTLLLLLLLPVSFFGWKGRKDRIEATQTKLYKIMPGPAGDSVSNRLPGNVGAMNNPGSISSSPSPVNTALYTKARHSAYSSKPGKLHTIAGVEPGKANTTGNATTPNNFGDPGLQATTGTVAPATITANNGKKDSAVAVNAGKAGNVQDAQPNDEKHEEDQQNVHWQTGLFWQAQLPFSSARHYFAGPNASSQPYRILLPGVWMTAKIDKDLFEAEINPFASTVYKPAVFTAVPVDSVLLATEIKRINKMFGVAVAGRYSYNVRGDWWLGGGIQGKVLTKGVATTEIQDNAGSSARTVAFASLNDSDWQNIARFQVRTDVQLLYLAGKWSAGLRAGVYFTPMAKNYGSGKNPLEVELFYRMALWRSKAK